jgi:hypothetical protein
MSSEKENHKLCLMLLYGVVVTVVVTVVVVVVTVVVVVVLTIVVRIKAICNNFCSFLLLIFCPFSFFIVIEVAIMAICQYENINGQFDYKD